MTQEAYQQGEASPGLIGQMLALLRLLIEAFAQAWTEEREKLRALRSCPAPDNWQAHWPPLRELEIKIHCLTLSGIEQLCTKGAVDLLTLTCIEDPAFVPTEPQTFEDMRARYEAVAAFMADPIPLMRQAAEQRPLRLDAAHRSTSPTLRVVEATHRCLASTSATHWGRWLRAQRADGGGRAHARAPPQRKRAAARDRPFQPSITRLAAQPARSRPFA